MFIYIYSPGVGLKFQRLGKLKPTFMTKFIIQSKNSR